MTAQPNQYSELGVDAMKGSVRKVFGRLINNDFLGMFVNAVRDPEHPGQVLTGHMDGDGSKIVQRILMFREHGSSNPKIFRGAADDGLSMNTGDVAAAGFTSGVLIVTDILNVNGFNIPKQLIMEQIGSRLAYLMDLYRRYGFNIYFLGGETADLPHQVQTVVFDVNVQARAKESDLIIGNVQPGDYIWGFASNGRAAWEDELNSGIMANGLTLARTVTMSADYTEKYPDLMRHGGAYKGKFTADFRPVGMDGMTIGEALVSPTRQWAILIKLLIDRLKECNQLHLLHGITMNTGGGATKVLHLGKGGILYRKTMPKPPRIFLFTQHASQEVWRNMYQSFNCGVGIDVIGDQKLGPFLRWVERETCVLLYELGACFPSGEAGNKVELLTQFGTFDDY